MRKVSVKDKLVGVIPEEALQNVNRSFEIVGDIAITEIPENLEKFEVEIARAIVESNSRVKTVLKKSGIHEGEFRTQNLLHIYGENKKETLYTENGITLEINPETVYFSAKLSTERQQLMDSLQENKKVLVMFSGSGPYTFVALRKQPNVRRITSVEINPEGHKYALRNLHHNKNLLKKSDLFKGLVNYLKENEMFIQEKELIQKVNSLKVFFYNESVKNLGSWTSLREYNEEVDSYDNEIFLQPTKELFKTITEYSIPQIFLDLDKLNFQQVLFPFIYFSEKFTFICKIEDKHYIFESNQEKGYLLNILEGETVDSVTMFDEIYMPLPKDAYDFLDVALTLAAKGCIIHMYDFVHENDFPHESEAKVFKAATDLRKDVKIIKTRKVGQYSPRKYRVCCDFKVLN